MIRTRLFIAALLVTSGLLGAGTAGAGDIRNTAVLKARNLQVPSNTVVLQGRSFCTPLVTPDGTPDAPARVLFSSAPGTLLIPYTVSLSGSEGGALTLNASVLSEVEGVQVRVQSDAGASQALENITLAPGESRQVMVAVVISRPMDASVRVNLSAFCGPRGDEQNVTLVNLRQETALLLAHTVLPADVQVGDTPTFTLSLPNSAPDTLSPALTVTLPDGLSYVPGSALRAGQAVPATVSADGRQVTFTPGEVQAGATLNITYRARVGVSAVSASGADVSLDAVGIARARRPGAGGEELVSNPANAGVRVIPGVFDRRASLIGEVFLDGNGNGRRDADDAPLTGARVLLSNGVQALTDEMGRYSVRNLTPGAWLVTLDPATAPFQAVSGFGTRMVDAFALTRADFALRVPGMGAVQDTAALRAAAARSTSVRSGPLIVSRSVTPAGSGSLVTLTVSSARPLNDVIVVDRATPSSDAQEFHLSSLTDTVVLRYLTPSPAGSYDPDVLWREP
ncbi:hypothetical protein [Deinococcus aquaticus]|uniref:hypothetical protein n=1 Tax=Deinococcus aquaticus TaxID=328692 RepID=UPI003F4840A9